jgi:hypothetical protein
MLWLRYNIRKFSLRGVRLDLAALPKGHRLRPASSTISTSQRRALSPKFFRLHHGLSLQSENAGFSRKAANWIQDDKGMLSCLERNQG